MYVYAYRTANHETLYVGSTRHVLNRFQQHRKESTWMEQVSSITVWGPYEDNEGLLCEKVLLSKEKPIHNINIAEGFWNEDAPILHQTGVSFKNYNVMKKYFHTLPDEPKRCTFYLLTEDYEALRILSHHCGESLSELTRNLLRDAILCKAAEIHRPDIYTEARNRLAKKKSRG